MPNYEGHLSIEKHKTTAEGKVVTNKKNTQLTGRVWLNIFVLLAVQYIKHKGLFCFFC